MTPLRALPEPEVLFPKGEGVDWTPGTPHSWQIVIPLGNDGAQHQIHFQAHWKHAWTLQICKRQEESTEARTKLHSL